jgi:hypothetical protein
MRSNRSSRQSLFSLPRLLRRFHPTHPRRHFFGIDARQKLEAVLLQACDDSGERERAPRFGNRPPTLARDTNSGTRAGTGGPPAAPTGGAAGRPRAFSGRREANAESPAVGDDRSSENGSSAPVSRRVGLKSALGRDGRAAARGGARSEEQGPRLHPLSPSQSASTTPAEQKEPSPEKPQPRAIPLSSIPVARSIAQGRKPRPPDAADSADSQFRSQFGKARLSRRGMDFTATRPPPTRRG